MVAARNKIMNHMEKKGQEVVKLKVAVRKADVLPAVDVLLPFHPDRTRNRRGNR